MSEAGAPRSGDERRSLGIRAIEWKIAWRHLRRAGHEEVPPWVRISLLGAIYMTLVGLGFLLYAAAGVDVAEGQQLFSGAELTASQRWFGVFGAIGLFVGVLWCIVSLLARYFNLLATIITVSVLVGCMALVVVLSLMTGLEADLRDKILNQKAHVLVSAEDGNRFADYEGLVEALAGAEGIAGASPFVEGEVMAKSGMNRQGGILRGVQPERLTTVSNLDTTVRRGKFEWLSDPAGIIEEDPFADDEGTPWRLRHLEGERPPEAAPAARPRAWAIGLPLGLMLLALGIGMRTLPWRQWLAPTVVVLLASGAVAALAPPAPDNDSFAEEEAAGDFDDPMLARLKPKPSMNDLPTPAAAAAPSESAAKSEARSEAKPEAKSEAKPASGAILRDIEGFGDATGDRDGDAEGDAPKAKAAKDPSDPELPEPRDFQVPAIKLEPTPAPVDDDDWEDPLVELGLPPGVSDSPPKGTVPAGPPQTQAGNKIEPVLQPPPKAAPPSRDEDDDADEGWEDPIEELGLDPAEDPADPAQPKAGPPPPATAPNAKKKPKGVPDAILVGDELAKELAVRVGSRVQLITPIGRMTPAGRVPGLLATKVGGIFYSGNYEYDRKNIYAPLGVVQRFLRTGDRVSGIEIKLDDADKINAGKATVERVLADLGRSELRAETWQELNKNLFSAMLLEKIAMGVALLFVVLVASFGILASNLMSVLEKAKEIAILKAMGAPDVQIQRVFVAEGLCVGLIGAVGGLLVGLGLCLGLDRFGFPFDENVYYIEQLPVVVNPLEVLLVGIAALGIIWGSSLYPARQAAKMHPVDGLRENDR